MKLRTVRRLLDVVTQDVPVRLVTRWHPSEVRLGVSDLEVFDLVEGHANTRLLLLDDLHAKLYVSDAEALAGSSNLTGKGLDGRDLAMSRYFYRCRRKLLRSSPAWNSSLKRGLLRTRRRSG